MIHSPAASLLYLDSETTGIPAAGNEALSVSIIDGDGTVLLDTKVRPVANTSWPRTLPKSRGAAGWPSRTRPTIARFWRRPSASARRPKSCA